MYDQKLMDKCIQHALKNPIQSRGRNAIGRMAALISNGAPGDDIFGWNKYKSHPLMYRFSKNHSKISLHAEIAALVDITSKLAYHLGMLNGNWNDLDLKNYDIYVARVLKDGTPALAKPCDTCMGALTYFGIRNIYWTK